MTAVCGSASHARSPATSRPCCSACSALLAVSVLVVPQTSSDPLPKSALSPPEKRTPKPSPDGKSRPPVPSPVEQAVANQSAPRSHCKFFMRTTCHPPRPLTIRDTHIDRIVEHRDVLIRLI